MLQQEQKLITEFPLIEKDILRLDSNLNLCGRFVRKNFYCKKDPDHEHLIKSVVSKFFCEIRYCANPECVIQRFRRQLETFEDISRFKGLRKLWHFAIGFEPIPEIEFKKNFSKYNKRFQYVLNRFFEKLRKKGLNIQAVRVLDFSFFKEGFVFLHFHFGAIPLSASKVRSSLILIQEVRSSMINRQKIKTPFHIQSFGLASKKGVLSYLAIRASGMYKYDMTSNVNYKHVQGNLRASIEKSKYLFLKDVLTKEEYLKSFYNKPFFTTIGGLPRPPPHGSNITDSMPCFCQEHGHLDRKDVRIEVIFESDLEEVPDPPPPSPLYPPLVVEYVRIAY